MIIILLKPNEFTRKNNSISTDLKNAYGYFVVWAEENVDLENNSHEWAFGNGANTPAGMGVPIIVQSELFAIGLSIKGAATCTVEVYKNNTLTGKRVSTSSNKKGTIDFKDTPVSYNVGDLVNFKTITGNANSNAGVVCAWFRYKLF